MKRFFRILHILIFLPIFVMACNGTETGNPGNTAGGVQPTSTGNPGNDSPGTSTGNPGSTTGGSSSNPNSAPTIDEVKARSLIAASNCIYKDSLADPYVCFVYESPYWIVKKEQCGGTCKVNESTQEVTTDVNAMCLGTHVAGECNDGCVAYTTGSNCGFTYACTIDQQNVSYCAPNPK